MLKGFLAKAFGKKSKDLYKDHLYALIIVGGGGTRLWPVSRKKSPKQFLKLFGGQTLTQITSYRFAKMLPWEKIYAVTTSEEYKREILKEVPEFLSKNIIVEPMKRSTAAAYALGALYISRVDPMAVLLNETADHLVDPQREYFKNLYAAAESVYGQDLLLTIGIKPTYPNVGYGYVKIGEKLTETGGKFVFKLSGFTEKPKLETAEKYLASGKYFWNGGEYVWSAQSFLKALSKHAPATARGMEKIAEAVGTAREGKILKEVYEKLPDISVDYAVSEKADNFIMIIADYSWTDIGDWKEVWENSPKDSSSNVIIRDSKDKSEVLNIDTTDAIIHTNGRTIAVVDVDNVAVIDTDDVLLVCAKSRAQSVKKLVEKLKEEKRTDLL
jgi:mannose-1-phosphate guanylyltransferase